MVFAFTLILLWLTVSWEWVVLLFCVSGPARKASRNSAGVEPVYCKPADINPGSLKWVKIRQHFSSELRWGWAFLKRKRILSRFQFSRLFIEFVLVETKQSVGSNPNMILTRQTYGQLSSTASGSTRWALAFYFSIPICYMFLISKHRSKSDLGLCTTSVLLKRIPLRIGEFRLKNVSGLKFRRNLQMRSGILFDSNKVVHIPRFDSLLHFGIWNI